MNTRPFAPRERQAGAPAPTKVSCNWCGDFLTIARDVRFGVNPAKPPVACQHLFNPFTKQLCGHRKFVKVTTAGMPPWACARCKTPSRGRKVKTRNRKLQDKPGPYGNGFFCSIECAFMFAIIVAQTGIFLRLGGDDEPEHHHQVVLPDGGTLTRKLVPKKKLKKKS